ncbi:type IV pilin protein [Halomonas alkalicola]|uniref:type IV pilin protein n=1 Tax=Halomonas alkalicola TaxID=1930622 RepID=UPI00265E3CC6|nr:type IV pilin protein [Halomonas alkalicola]
MIAVAVIGILASIAYPSYQRYVQEARRTDAKSALMQIAGQLERCYTVSSDYSSDICPSGEDIPSEEGLYLLDIDVPSSSEYTITAIPHPQRSQTRDAACLLMSIDQRGAREPDECW